MRARAVRVARARATGESRTMRMVRCARARARGGARWRRRDGNRAGCRDERVVDAFWGGRFLVKISQIERATDERYV
jgi:hypothetical protein